ncbi:MAG: U32 family peptidase, partial [Candidatus Marinimicrobia bacterium]|nr:U32 family peptidase [Candidatus Neomarinimicrobiota bacterium]
NNWKIRLKTVFNRGFWNGYYLGQRLGEWSEKYGSKATRRRVYIGKGVNYFRKSQIAEFIIDTNSLEIGDRILITGPTTGVIEMIIDEIWVNENPVQKAHKGERITIPLSTVIRPSDRLYKLIDTK